MCRHRANRTYGTMASKIHHLLAQQIFSIAPNKTDYKTAHFCISCVIITVTIVQPPYIMVFGSHSRELCCKWSVNRHGHNMYSYTEIGSRCTGPSMNVYFSCKNRQQLCGSLTEHLFFITVHN